MQVDTIAGVSRTQLSPQRDPPRIGWGREALLSYTVRVGYSKANILRNFDQHCLATYSSHCEDPRNLYCSVQHIQGTRGGGFGSR